MNWLRLSFVSDKKGQEEHEDNRGVRGSCGVREHPPRNACEPLRPPAMGLSNTHQDLEISSDPTELRTPQDGEKPQQGRNA